MIEPVQVQNIMTSAIAGALIILSGAVYACFFALYRIKKQPGFIIGAYCAYALLVISVFNLSNTLNLNGFWQIVTVVMLVGYFLAPRIIWQLCIGTHARETDEEQVVLKQTTQRRMTHG